jgi:glycerol-3-phosphate acyltransferase PlsX
MKIALDAMGGDFAPKAVVQGALLASKEVSKDTTLVLVGQEEAIRAEFTEGIPANVEIVDAPQVIGMAEHPTKALSQKPQSSISIGYQLLKNKEVDAFCSAGNTGAMLVGAIFSVQVIPGVLRPTIISHVPKLDGSYGIILDVGANTDCKPEVLAQFGEIGAMYCQHVFKTDNPKVALLSLGEEEQKGNLHTQAAHQLLKKNERLNFVGNIEGRDLFNESADVIVCDGYVGNVVIKMAESYYEILKKQQYSNPFFDNFNYEVIGGSPVLGINGNVVIAHGVSNDKAICSAIMLSERLTQAELYQKIQHSLKEQNN